MATNKASENVSDNWLEEIFREFSTMGKRFWDIIWSNIGHFFPEDFDTGLLRLNSILSDIQSDIDAWRIGESVCRIDLTVYWWGLDKLHKQIKAMHWMDLDWFRIEIQAHNFEYAETYKQLYIKFKKDEKDKLGATARWFSSSVSSLISSKMGQ
ncbi:MAG: hypothetical protein ACD_2C00153G0003 [uncultured bacterium (gcode 4)]|uniref:Uncharacterized protein n=1 Tax=uncultured bacterium (gcode 4) TaxID=1234023 RepID=K2G5I3_9BACT|nr:MAG: hypothetical protein ACD_2C00153G0003 [uncultured bacterium (gcode 4)]